MLPSTSGPLERLRQACSIKRKPWRYHARLSVTCHPQTQYVVGRWVGIEEEHKVTKRTNPYCGGCK